MALLVVRLRGTVNIPYWALTTLQNLHLNKRFSATLVPETSDYLGMLKKINQWIAWSKADSEIVRTLIIKRGKKLSFKINSLSKKGKDIQSEQHEIDALVNGLVNDKIKFSEVHNIKPWFNLNPPKGGFKRNSKKQFSDGGILGNNKELVEIVKKMV